MPSTYTSRTKLELQATGENPNVWGVKLNNDLGRVDYAVKGVASFALSGSATLTSSNTSTNPADYQAIAAILNITGGTGGTVTVPANDGIWTVRNGASGNVWISNGSDSVLIVPGEINTVWTDGTSVYKGVPGNSTNFPVQSGHAGKFLRTDGESPSWEKVTDSGTWNPTVTFSTPGNLAVAYDTRTGRYSRVGDIVFLSFALQFTPTFTTASGIFLINGQPFAFAGSDGDGGALSVMTSTFSLTAGRTFASVARQGVSSLGIAQMGSASPVALMTTANLTSGAVHGLQGSISFRV